MGGKRNGENPSVVKEERGSVSPVKNDRKSPEEKEEVWKWWVEERRDDGVKWKFLEHKGPVFAAAYEKLPKSVVFKYNGKAFKLSRDAEEIAGFYSRFIEHDYTTKEKFNINFFKDWRKSMTPEERDHITDLKKCDFKDINEYYKMKSEERKGRSKEEKQKEKADNEALIMEYGIAIIDGHKEKIGNFRIEPPGLFRGRGDHPKMGMLKKRVVPEDVIINCSKDSNWPKAPEGHRWKEVRHDNTVTWLACWTENVQGQQKYVMLNPTSCLKGEKDWMKYEKARELAKHIDVIRENYKKDFKSKEMRIRQRAVAMYFIDKLALRAGNEKDEDQADTVGCCSLRFEHIQLQDSMNDKENVVVFDFLGKDSIRYYNEVEVEKRVYKNLKIFMENKKEGDDLFDRLNTGVLNKHLNELMSGLTAKVFRTYNASHTLQQQLNELTPEDGTVAEKVLAYNRANRAVAILCNHQRAVPKTHEKSMENLVNKISAKNDEISKTENDLKGLSKETKDFEKKTAALKRLKEQLQKLEMDRTEKEDGKEIALGTSKLNYLDPRISVAWCKKYNVPIEKVYNKTQRDKFRWAVEMATAEYQFGKDKPRVEVAEEAEGSEGPSSNSDAATKPASDADPVPRRRSSRLTRKAAEQKKKRSSSSGSASSDEESASKARKDRSSSKGKRPARSPHAASKKRPKRKPEKARPCSSSCSSTHGSRKKKTTKKVKKPAGRKSKQPARKAAEKRSSSSGSASSDEESTSKTRKDRSSSKRKPPARKAAEKKTTRKRAAKRPATKKRPAGAATKKKAKK